MASSRRQLLLLCCALIGGSSAAAQEERADLRIVILEGDGAINNVRARIARDARVRLEDGTGQPLSGVPVTFVAPAIGVGGSFNDDAKTTTVITDDEGEAVARGFRPNALTGQFQINATASHRGEMARVTITQTNAAPVQEARTKRMVILGLVAGAVAGGAIAATSLGGGREPAPAGRPPTPSLGLSPGSPTFGPPQ